MKALTKGLMTMALLAATAACDGSPTAGSALVAGNDAFSAAKAPSGTLTFSSTQSYSEQTPQTASGGTGTISFTGSLTTGTQVLTNNNYTGTISGLPAGTYTLNVVHQGGFDSGQTAYSGTVTVQ